MPANSAKLVEAAAMGAHAKIQKSKGTATMAAPAKFANFAYWIIRLPGHVKNNLARTTSYLNYWAQCSRRQPPSAARTKRDSTVLLVWRYSHQVVKDRLSTEELGGRDARGQGSSW